MGEESLCNAGDAGSIGLGWEDPLEEGMETHSSILAWKIPQTEEPGRLYSLWGCNKLDMSECISPKDLGDQEP